MGKRRRWRLTPCSATVRNAVVVGRIVFRLIGTGDTLRRTAHILFVLVAVLCS